MVRRKRWRGWNYLLLLTGGLLFLTLIVLPLLTTYLAKTSQTLPQPIVQFLSLADDFLTWLLVVFAGGWFFFLGGTFASFLNVVAARVPNGKSILGSSHCPYCAVKLSFKDNIPVFGWLKNGGRCSTCRLPITSRYLYVELVLGFIFLALAMTTLLSDGATLPIRSSSNSSALVHMFVAPSPELLSILALQLVVLLGLYVFTLIELDRQKIPLLVWLTVVVFAVGIVAVWPQCILISWIFPLVEITLPLSRPLSLITVGVGMAAGFLIGFLLDAVISEKVRPSEDVAEDSVKEEVETQSATTGQSEPRVCYGLSLVGIFGGWQSVAVTAVIYIFIKAISSNFADRSGEGRNYIGNLFWSPNAALLTATLIHIFSWSWFNHLTM